MQLRLITALFLVLLGSGCINTRPRPMTLTCNLSKEQFVEECTRLLRQNGYKIIEENAAMARVRATKGQNQTNMGENMQYNGPYLFDATYDEGRIVVSVATIIRVINADEQPFILQTHNEGRGTSGADKKFFVPVLDGLRKRCARLP
ncbi:hypothetical protein [Tellurirhabdus rosea]|uniref:hypothetical protein n=1 Tax=Tellurirhabdus rosea TaxID=2674997 RepID=UPI00225AB3BD|nr:hypothetical protein [Tellurirhabdus rosea]